MDSRRSQPDTGTAFVRQAESLIRSLAGVIHARILATPGGIDAIHVVATDDRAASAMPGHVRSALLAGLATPVIPARIHVRTGAAGEAPAATDDEIAAATAVAEHETADRSAGRDRLRLVHGAAAPELLETGGVRLPGRAAPDVAIGVPGEAGRTAVDRARLIAVDVRRPGDGRMVCRVSVAWNGDVHRAEAVAMDLPGAAAQAAAQAAVRALGAGGLDGLELNGLREVEIAGRDYVLVALRRDDGPAVRHRAGSALMFGTPERSAAEAAVDAANALI